METGWHLDEMILESLQGTANSLVRLDRRAADRRVYPAIDVVASCTRELQKLAGEQRALGGQAIADALVEMEEGARGSAIDWVLEQMTVTRSNTEILEQLARRS